MRRPISLLLMTVALAGLGWGQVSWRRSLMRMESSAFQSGGTIPRKYTCDGADVSPDLKWSGAPNGTKSFALIADDPDAPGGTWVHWVLFNLSPTTNSLAEGVSTTDAATGGVQGSNDFKKIGYGGPCPPPGKPHHYFFKLYALSTMLDLKSGATKQDVEAAMKAHVLSTGELMGTYQRGR